MPSLIVSLLEIVLPSGLFWAGFAFLNGKGIANVACIGWASAVAGSAAIVEGFYAVRFLDSPHAGEAAWIFPLSAFLGSCLLILSVLSGVVWWLLNWMRSPRK